MTDDGDDASRTEFVIARASPGDLDEVAPLFDAYRQFYGKSPDLDGARRFLRERLRQHQSVIFLARDGCGEGGVGFTQLYPIFSSTSLQSAFVLNDLFVHPDRRGKRIGRGLLDVAASFARNAGAGSLTLATAPDNRRAQSLYTATGWVRDDYVTYELRLA